MTLLKAEKIVSRLSDHPMLMERMEHLLNIIDNPDGRATLADDAEILVTQELRSLGKEMLEEWSQNEAEKAEKTVLSSGVLVKKKTKKKSISTQPTAK